MPTTEHCSRCAARSKGLFACLAARKLERLMHERSSREYLHGEPIFYAGNPALAVYCVGEGQVKLWRTGPHGDSQSFGTRGPGDLLGWRAALVGGSYAVTAEPLERSRVCLIPRASFVDVVRDDAQLSFAMLTRMALVTRETEDHLMARSVDPVRQRTARFLRELLPATARGCSAPVELPDLLPRHEMAELIGTTAETLSRTLHALQLSGVVDFDSDHFIVRDPQELSRIAR